MLETNINKTKKLIIIGTGETGLLAYEYFKYDSNYEVAAFSVHKEFISDQTIEDLPVIAIEDLQEHYPPNEYETFVAISSGKLNRNRRKTYQEIKLKGYTCANYISSKAFVWHNVIIGENCFIFEDNTLQPFVEIGNNVTLWSGNHIGHNSEVKDNAFISSHCVISGFCTIGENSFLGVNCTIENNTVIAKDNFLGASTLLRKDTKIGSFFQNKQSDLAKISSYKLFKIQEA